MRRRTAFTALTHSIVPALQARIHCRVTLTNLVAGEALALTNGDGRGS